MKDLIKNWDLYSKDKEILENLDIPEGQPILSFAGFISWYKNKKNED